MLTIDKRKGDKPLTNAEPPHLQKSQQSPREVYSALNVWAFNSFDLVREEPTRISVPTSRAMWLDENVPASSETFMPPLGSREFAHTHLDGSMHLMLAPSEETIVIDAGWGELHPWHSRGVREILIYAPRDEKELETIKAIVRASYDYVVFSQQSARTP